MSDFKLMYGNDGLWYGIFTHLEQHGVKHAISTRLKGVSTEPYTSLNLALHVGDTAESVVTNRRLFCEAVGVDGNQLVTAEQVHGERIAIVRQEDAGKGALVQEKAIRETDALITNVKGLPLMLFYADCVPVLIFDCKKRIAGVSHAGWKGTVAKITQKTVLAMQEHFATKPQDCLVGIGPSIGPCCYEVDEKVKTRFDMAFAHLAQEFFRPKGERWLLDLWKANVVQLMDCGVKAENIVTSGVCTQCNNELFFSYRAENGRTGRLGALIAL